MFYTVPTLYQVQASLKSSSLLATSITLSPFQSIGKVYCYQCVPAESQIFSFNILLRKFKLWPQWFLGLCSINLIFTTLNFLLPVTQTHLVYSDLCPSTSSLVHFYSGHKKRSSNVTTPFMKPSWLYKQNSSLLALQSYSTVKLSLYFTSSQYTEITVVSPSFHPPIKTVTFSKKKTMSPISVPSLRMGTHWVLKDNVRQKWKYYSLYCAFSPKFHNWTTEIRQNFTKHFCLTLYCTPMPYQQ